MARQTTYELLPATWRRLDTDTVLERFLNVWEYEYEIVASKIQELLTLQNPDKTQDRYLPLLGLIVGHRWNNDESYSWNRKRIKDCIHRHSYKGSRLAKDDIIIGYGGNVISTTDMASTLLVLGRQGRLGKSDCVVIAPDFYHDGAFLFDIDHHIDTPEFYAEFEEQRPAGQVWWYRISLPLFGLFDSDWAFGEHSVEHIQNLDDGLLGRTLINDIPLPFRPSGWFALTEHSVDWQFIHNYDDGALGMATLGNEFTLGQPPQGEMFILGGDAVFMTGQVSGYLWADSLVDSDMMLTVEGALPDDVAGIQISLNIDEQLEV